MIKLTHHSSEVLEILSSFASAGDCNVHADSAANDLYIFQIFNAYRTFEIRLKLTDRARHATRYLGAFCLS